jgi:micrococcal nuclease
VFYISAVAMAKKLFRIRHKTLTVFFTFMVALFMVVGSFSGVSLTPTERAQTNSPAIPEETLAPAEAPFAVVKVVDGDTIDVAMVSGTARIRLIGINAPESVDPRKKVECFGKEASAHLYELLVGKQVRLAADPTQDDRDVYKRLLRYVTRDDGTAINETMVRDGYAYEYTYKVPYEQQARFRAAEKEAKEAGRGLWAPETCGGKKAK